ncbi:MAG: hypothetical protein HY240_01220 [Actinobacteria bacterium]|nr:hypothetical protein [Actinomycetota bacterium]
MGGRVALSGGRGSLARVALMAAGIGLGVALLLGSLAFDHAIQAGAVREAARYPGAQLAPDEPQPMNSTLMWEWRTTFEGHDVWLIALHGRGRAPVPPGITGVPSTGQVFVSPGLATLLDSPSGSLLAPRLGGSVAGPIEPDGLVTPSEIFGYVGVRPGLKGLSLVDGQLYTGGSKQSFSMLTPGSLIVLGLAILAFLFPVALFVITATRLSTATREARLAAIRLAGATNVQVRGMIAIEAAMVAVLGAIIGCLLFLLGRTMSLKISAVAAGWFPSELWPQPVAAAAVLLIVPALVLLVALVGSRRMIVSPLGLVRRTRRRRRGAAWVCVGLAGALALGFAALGHAWVMRQRSPIPGVIIVGAGLLFLAGLVGEAGWVSWLVARVVGSRTRSVSAQLGARRMEADPGSANRVVAGIAVLVTLVGLGQAVALADARDRSGMTYVAPWVRDLPATIVIAEVFDYPVVDPASLLNLIAVPGVLSVRLTRQEPSGGVTLKPSSAIVATDGEPATLERIRNAVGWRGDAQPVSFWRSRASAGATERTVAHVAQAISLVILLVTAASLLVSTVDGMMERRRPLAVLSAIGARRSTLRRSILVQVAIPLAVALGLGASGAIFLTVTVFHVIGERGLLPLRPLAELTVAVGVVVLAVTGLAMPWAGWTRRADLLHAE